MNGSGWLGADQTTVSGGDQLWVLYFKRDVGKLEVIQKSLSVE